MHKIAMTLLVAIALLATSAFADDAQPLAPATMRELARIETGPPLRHEEHERPLALRRWASAIPAAAQARATTTGAPPATTFGFQPMVDHYDVYPSDAAGAVGRTHIVSSTNYGITVHDRTGNLLSSVTTRQFWEDSTLTPGAIYDQRVAYDAVANRFIIIGLYDLNFTNGKLLVAVSQSGDPTAGWQRYQLSVDPNPFISADFSRMATTRDNLVVVADIYDGDSFIRAAAFVINNSDLFAAAASLPFTRINSTSPDITPVRNSDNGTMYFIDNPRVVPPTSLGLAKLDNGHIVTFGFFTTANDGAFNNGNFTTPLVGPQFGTNIRMDCGCPCVQDATVKNGVIWMAESGYMSNPTRASVRWWKANIGSPGPAQTGLINDSSGQRSFAFPSVAANGAGSALIGYSLFDTTAFPSAGYTGIDAKGNASDPGVLKSGEAPYYIGRWADFSTTTVDPVNDLDFWTVQTYAIDGINGQAPRWAVWWGKVPGVRSRGRAVRH